MSNFSGLVLAAQNLSRRTRQEAIELVSAHDLAGISVFERAAAFVLAMHFDFPIALETEQIWSEAESEARGGGFEAYRLLSKFLRRPMDRILLARASLETRVEALELAVQLALEIPVDVDVLWAELEAEARTGNSSRYGYCASLLNRKMSGDVLRESLDGVLRMEIPYPSDDEIDAATRGQLEELERRLRPFVFGEGSSLLDVEIGTLARVCRRLRELQEEEYAGLCERMLQTMDKGEYDGSNAVFHDVFRLCSLDRRLALTITAAKLGLAITEEILRRFSLPASIAEEICAFFRTADGCPEVEMRMLLQVLRLREPGVGERADLLAQFTSDLAAGGLKRARALNLAHEAKDEALIRRAEAALRAET